MTIKLTVTRNKYPTGISPISAGKGINKGLLLRVQDSIKDPSSSVNAQVTLAMEKAARVRIMETRQRATNHFEKTMTSLTKLAQNSTVDAVSGGLGTSYTALSSSYFKRNTGKGRTRYEAEIVRPVVLLKQRKSIAAHISAPDVGVSTTATWKTLNHNYFNSSPKSEKFFTKRKGTQRAGSSQLVMLRDLKTFKSKVSASSNIGLNPIKGTPASISGKTSLTLKYSYTLAFPSLHKFDFIRKAYVHATKGAVQRFPKTVIEADGKNTRVFDKNYGILYAERLRPFFRVFAAEAGKDLRKKLNKSP